MAVLLLAWIYITFVCFCWGHLTLRIINGQNTGKANIPNYWFFICLAGMAALGLFTGLCSLFFPIGYFVHLLALIPCILYPIFYKIDLSSIQAIKTKRSIPWLKLALTISLLLLVLLISSSAIIHPDTVMYHAPFIKWMESYKAITGLVNYDARLGYQSSWFGLVALFRFDFVFPNNFILLNGCLSCWFLLFISQQIFSPYNNRYRWIWIGLLFICISCWQLIRLTAASASPDFIVALMIWVSFYAFLQKSTDRFFSTPIVVLFSCAAVATKLSAIVILLLPILIGLQLLRQRNLKRFGGCLLIGGILILPGSARSIVNAGYPFYPSTMLDVFSVEWKTDQAKVRQEEHYISAYARFPVDDYRQAEEVVQMRMNKWVPLWWKNLSLTDKFLLVLLFLLLISNIILIKSWFSYKNKAVATIALIALAGSIFWFIEFPDPRFGYGFLISLLLCLLTHLTLFIVPLSGLAKQLFKPVLMFMIAALFSYSFYRIIHFMSWRQLLTPEGVENVNHDGFSTVPRYPLPPDVQLRTGRIEDGFKSK